MVGCMDGLNYFSIDLARKYGVEQSVMINFLLKSIEGNNTFNRKIINGRKWIYLYPPDVDFYLQFWNEQKINKILSSLVYHKVLERRVIPELGKGASYSFIE